MKKILILVATLFVSLTLHADTIDSASLTADQRIAVGYGATENEAYNDARRAANWECSPGVITGLKVTFQTVQDGFKAIMNFRCREINR